MKSYYPEELNGFFMVGSCGYFHFNIIYSQLAAIDNVVLGGHDEKHVSQCRLRTLWFAFTAEQLERKLLNLWPAGGRSRLSVYISEC
jgi:hypothetical protein